MNHDAFPSWNTMIFTDIGLIVLAVAGTAVIVAKWSVLKESTAATGLGLILTGVWIEVLFYVVDFFTMTVMPLYRSMDDAMHAMHVLHVGYGWYFTSAATAFIVVGLVLTVFNVVRQFDMLLERTRALQENESLLNSIFENVPVAFLIKNKDHVIERPNQTYLDWYGFAYDEMAGRRSDEIEDFQPDADAVRMTAQEDEVLATGETNRRTVTRRFADGEMHTISITKFPVYDQSGAITRVGSVTVDLTEQIRAQDMLNKALLAAEEANRSKSEFLAMMSHELRTPLNAILGFSEMLRQEYFGPLGAENYRVYANDIHETGRHLLELINDLLDISAIEAGRRTFENEVFSLDDVIADCLKGFESAAGKKGISLTGDVDPGLPPIHADRRSVTQIVYNLLSNAVKFTEPGGSVGLSVRLENDAFVITVRDTGIGIPKSELKRVTEPFSQVRENPMLAHEGTGLGLAIVKSLLDSHRGALIIESEVNAGTTVTARLPARQRADQ